MLQAGLRNVAARRHAARQPDIAANARTAPDGDAPEDGGAGIDDDFIFKDRVARRALFQRAAFILREALGAQCHGLVKPDMLADDGGFADDDARPMIDEEALADLRPRMNVNASRRVGDFREDAGDQRHAQHIQRVGQPVMDHRQNPRVAEQDLVDTARRRVALVGGQDVGIEQAAQRRQLAGEGLDDLGRMRLDALLLLDRKSVV